MHPDEQDDNSPSDLDYDPHTDPEYVSRYGTTPGSIKDGRPDAPR